MPRPDYDGARKYALERLEHELAAELLYHSLAHTRDDVVPAARQFAAVEGIAGERRLLLETAAYFHDLGFVEQRLDHELVGIRIVRDVLPGFGYLPAQIEVIASLLLATRLPQSPQNLLEEILVDADLDVLGREDYWTRNLDLRHEWAAYGQYSTDLEWFENQLVFMRAHQYFTSAARRLRGPKKQENIDRLVVLLRQLRADGAKA